MYYSNGAFHPRPAVGLSELVDEETKRHITNLENLITRLSTENEQLKRRIASYEDYQKVITKGSKMQDLAYEIGELFSD